MKTILYTKKFNENIKEKVNIILSPEFYWIKKIDIPIKSIKDAKKLAKSLFDLKGEYVFEAFKIKNTFFAVALPKKLNLNIDKKYINSIRIAQIEFFDFECIKVDENYYLRKIDDLIFFFPSSDKNCILLEDVLKKIKLSKHTFSLERMNKTLLIYTVVIFLILNSSFLIKTYSNQKEAQKIYIKTREFLKKNSLPLTSFELESILNELKSKVKKEKNIKKALEIFSNTPLKKGEFYKKISFDSKNYYIEIHTSKNLDFYFKKYFKIISSASEKNLYKAKLK